MAKENPNSLSLPTSKKSNYLHRIVKISTLCFISATVDWLIASVCCLNLPTNNTTIPVSYLYVAKKQRCRRRRCYAVNVKAFARCRHAPVTSNAKYVTSTVVRVILRILSLYCVILNDLGMLFYDFNAKICFWAGLTTFVCSVFEGSRERMKANRHAFHSRSAGQLQKCILGPGLAKRLDPVSGDIIAYADIREASPGFDAKGQMLQK